VIGVLTLSFDPVVVLSDTASIRLETIALALVLFAGLLVAAWIGGRQSPTPLRTDDLIFMAVGAVPGAIVGGRLGYVIDHWAFYQANPALVADPSQGGFTITLAIPLGILTGAIIGRLLGSPIGRWMHVLALPLLFALAGGKLAGVLGGTGQGAPSDLSWATSYAGPGPWGSLAADLPSHPSQVYEAIAIVAVIVALWLVSHAPLIARGDGAAMWTALALWAVARFAVAFSWRDPATVGVLRVEQVMALGVALLAVVGLLERWRAHRRSPAAVVASVPAPTEAPGTLDADAAARAEAEALAEAETGADPDAGPA
jgi:phosphatidylglycerol:prolipoprotein diacylglycerol transferase